MDVCAGVSVQISDKVIRIISKCCILSILCHYFDNKLDIIVVLSKNMTGIYTTRQIKVSTLLLICQSCCKSGVGFQQNYDNIGKKRNWRRESGIWATKDDGFEALWIL